MANCLGQNSSEEIVLQQLHELFGSILNVDVIKTVAATCKYDVQKSSNKLLEITNHSMTNKNLIMNPAAVGTAISKKSKKATDIERAIDLISKGWKVLVILRGLPGSGKSYLGKQILFNTLGHDANVKNHILSSDDYFCQNAQGVYKYDPRFIEEAHNWNLQKAFQVMSRGYSPVIIDNTNTQMWEMKPYATMATDYGYIVEILEPDNHWCFNDKELTKRNQHGVPKARIQDMLRRYEKNVTPQKLLNAYNLSYKLQKPPQLRLYPPPNITVNTLNISKFKPCVPNRNVIIDKPIHYFLGVNQVEQNEKIVDTIDLMDFNDDHSSNQSETAFQNRSQNCGLSNSSQNVSQFSSAYSIFDGEKSSNSVDDILMCTNDSSSTTTSNCLMPQLNANMETISIDSSDDERSISKVPISKPVDIQNSWGVNEDILRSWDIVTPLEDVGNAPSPMQAEVTKKLEMKNASCITEDDCFMLLKNRKTNVQILKVIETANRDINRNTPKNSPMHLPIPKKVMLDKSCMTEDVYEDFENHMSELINLFPMIPKNSLNYWYNKCKGDLEWTIEFLLEAKDEIDTLYIDDMWDSNENDNKSSTLENLEMESSNPVASTSATGIKNKKFKKSLDQDNEIKKLLESKVDINDKYYSKHVLKVKNYKFNKHQGDSEVQNSESNTNTTQSSLSICDNNKKIEDIIAIDDNSDDYDSSDNEDSAKSDLSTDEIMELNLGEHFVTQLENEFGDPNIEYPKGFQPVVQVPVSLARQLYAFYMESVYQQMENQRTILETLTKEDEEFARKLQAKEQEEVSAPQQAQSMNLKEIMDEQVAQSIYERETSLWRNLDPENWAAKLTRQKLCSTFPKIDEGTLVEILHAHDNNYKETVESLLASTGMTNAMENVEKIKEPPITDTVLEEMKEARKANVIEEYTEQREATFYRQEANKFLQKRSDLYQKAQVYHQRGMNEVAQFYSMLASQQTQYYERANSLAATAFLDEHSKRLKDFNTLDLHFLYVKEAIPSLDVFLDRNINLLRYSNSKQSESLQIITGRGKNSGNGIPKLRPAVQARLKARNIKFQQLNAGLIQIKVTKNSLVTSELCL